MKVFLFNYQPNGESLSCTANIIICRIWQSSNHIVLQEYGNTRKWSSKHQVNDDGYLTLSIESSAFYKCFYINHNKKVQTSQLLSMKLLKIQSFSWCNHIIRYVQYIKYVITIVKVNKIITSTLKSKKKESSCCTFSKKNKD